MKPTSYSYKISIAYDGTQYGGWQVQLNAVSIQALIEHALFTVTQKKCCVIGSGRTDAGVHALEQIAHFSLEHPIDTYKILYALNCMLPKDIRILTMHSVDAHFHARFSAISKTYHYRLHLHPIPNPFTRFFAYRVPHKVDIALLKAAAAYFLGTHDFTSFANEAKRGSASVDPIRTLFRLDVVEEPEGLRLEFEGDGFLYKMVRNIVGTLLDVADHKIEIDELPAIFGARDRSSAGKAAPPHGLYLVRVSY